jgi:LDH2 family malate/lactate/ureidoglycolate dehydrogenase
MSNKEVIQHNIEAVRTQLMRASQACSASENVTSVTQFGVGIFSASTKPVFATNPIGFSAPRGDSPLLINQARSQVANGARI